MPYEPKQGDYISYEDSDGKVLYGRIKSADEASGTVVITKYKDGKDLASASVTDYSKLGHSNWARMKMRAKPNGWEVLENAVVGGIYYPLVAGDKLMDSEYYSFLLADITHEFITKQFAESIADMLLPTTLEGSDATDFFSTSDFSDALRKAPFVIALQQMYQKMVFRKSWGHKFISNSIGDFVILAVSNLADRMWSASEDGYTYP